MIDQKLLAMLRCPVSGGSLLLADAALIQRVQEAIGRGEARDRLEQKVTAGIDGGLVDASRQWLYPIRDGIPTLVAEEAIDLRETS
jgi:uncharacterized protein YbaR (Trm112 family)